MVWILVPAAATVALSAEFKVAVEIGLLPFDRSFGAGSDGEWLTLLATVTGLAAITSALGGVVAAGLASGVMRHGSVVLVAVAGLTTLPFLRRMAAQARDVGLARGGPVHSVTFALVAGLALGGIAGWVVAVHDWRALATGLAVTVAALWVIGAVGVRVAIGVPPLGLPNGLLQTRNMPWLVPCLWLVIGGLSALIARRFSASRATVLLSGVLGAVLASLSFFTARPSEPYFDHLTVQTSALSLAIVLVGAAFLGAVLVVRLASYWRS